MELYTTAKWLHYDYAWATLTQVIYDKILHSHYIVLGLRKSQTKIHASWDNQCRAKMKMCHAKK